MSYDTILASAENRIGIIQLNRPEALNALNDHLLSELADALKYFLKDDEVRCIIIAGGEKAFCAGADLKEMISRGPKDVLDRFTSSVFGLLRHCPKPVIAAVSGYCFAGGCELALACDMIVASETAKFGQPEINVGIMPGAGGTQRWTHIAGKARAMEIVLTGALSTPAKRWNGELSTAWRLLKNFSTKQNDWLPRLRPNHRLQSAWPKTLS